MAFQQHALRAADRVAGALGLLDRDIGAAGLLAQARRGGGPAGFGPDVLTEPLEVLTRSYAEEAGLSLVGRATARWDVRRFLSNLARMAEQERRQPGIADEPVAAPVFVTGLPRSGTTFLHRLLAEHPAHRVVQVWEAIYPYPNPYPDWRRAGARDRRVARVDRQLRAFARLSPEFPSLHPIDAASPQECTEITAHVFRSLRFETTHEIPSYRTWLRGEGQALAYRFHKRFLQHLQAQDRAAGLPVRRWVLKAPEHVFALDALREVYPDARLIFLHRDPLKVLPSVARLTEVLRAPFTRSVDRHGIGRMVAGDWLDGAARLVEMAQQTQPPGRVAHVHYRALVQQPLETVADVCRQLGLPLADDATSRIARLVERQPRGGYGHNRYHFEDYGLDPAAERARFRRYTAQFGVEPEVAVPTASQAAQAA